MVQLLISLMFLTSLLYNWQVFPIANSYGVTSLDLVTIFFYIYIFKRIIWNGDKLLVGWHKAIYFLFGLFLAVIISGFTPLLKGSSPQLIQYFKTSVHIFFLAFFVIITMSYPIKTVVWTNAIKMWLVLSVIINIFGIYQIPARAYDLPFAWLDFTNVSMGVRGEIDISEIKQLSLHWGNYFRATSIFPEPSALASFNVVILIFLLIPYIQKSKPFFKSKIFNTILFITTLSGLFLTFSMTGFTGILIVLIGIFLVESFRRLLPLFIIVTASMFIIILNDTIIKDFTGVSVVDLFGNRIQGIWHYDPIKKEGMEGESFYGRMSTAERSINIWKEYPINGIGMGLISYDKKQGLKFNDFSSFTALSELGLLGFISFTGMFVVLIIFSGKYIINKKLFLDLSLEHQRLLGLLFYLMLHQVIINFVTGNNLVKDALWIPMGMIFGIINATLIKKGEKVYTIGLMRIPLKETFSKSLKKYIYLKENRKSI